VQQRLPRRFDSPILFAHRGARAHAPENSLAAFDLALKLGANGIETDAWLSKDGVVVLDHDGYRRTRTSRRWIRDFDAEDLPFPAVTLEALLHHVPLGSCSLSIDVKDAAAFSAVVDAVSRAGMVERTFLCHPDLSVLESWLPDRRGARLVHSTRHRVIRDAPESHAAALARLGIDVCNMHHTDWSGGLVALYHRFEIAAFAWDVQFESVARTMLLMGMDGVFGDDVEILHTASVDSGDQST
jgi:glycerophosphoryl diester phosphodiesterase